jgi:hypothetical protein
MLLLAGCLCAGCETWGMQNTPRWIRTPEIGADEQAQRTKYQTEQSSEAVRWLLSHKVRQGMSLQDVAAILGEEGAPVDADNWIKNDAVGYQVGDETYRWGPDDRGNSYYLVFRHNKLVNFDPAEFAEGL